MAVITNETILGRLRERIALDGKEEWEVETNKLDIFDTFHDFRDGTERGIRDCCSTEINQLTQTQDGYLRIFGIPPSNVEKKSEEYFEKTIPKALGKVVENQVSEMIQITYSQILTTPAVLTSCHNTSVEIIADVEPDTDEKKKIIANALLVYFFGQPNIPTGVFFTYDASHAISKDIMMPLTNTVNAGFYTGQIITPQNMADSAMMKSSGKSSVFDGTNFEGDIPIVGEAGAPVNNERGRYISTFTGNTSNYFVKNLYGPNAVFGISNQRNGIPYTLSTPYSFTYTITLPGGVIEIPFALDANGAIGKSGPSVMYLKSVIRNEPVEDVTCTKITVLTEQGLTPPELQSAIFDIKRSGDHEQANALLAFIMLSQNHRGIFQTLDILSAVYSRLLGNPTIYTLSTKAASKMLCYRGAPKVFNEVESQKQILVGLVSYINRILNVYLAIINSAQNPMFSSLVANLIQVSNYTNPDKTIELLIKIKAYDAILYLKMMESLTRGDQNTVNGLFSRVQAILAEFGKEMNEANMFTGIQVEIPIDNLSESQISNAIQLIQTFVNQTKDIFSNCEQYLQYFNRKQVVSTSNGGTYINIQPNFFLLDAAGAITGVVANNSSIDFDFDEQIKETTKILNSTSVKTRRSKALKSLTSFFNNLLNVDRLYNTQGFQEVLDNIDAQYNDTPTTHRQNINNNILTPFLATIQQLATAQAGGNGNNSSSSLTDFYKLLNGSTEVIVYLRQIIPKNNSNVNKNIQIYSGVEMLQIPVIQMFNTQSLTRSITAYSSYNIIVDSLLEIKGLIGLPARRKDFYNDKEVELLGGGLWIIETLADVASEFDDMMLSLQQNNIEIDIASMTILTNFNNFIKSFLSLMNQFYDEESDNYNIDGSKFTADNIQLYYNFLKGFGSNLNIAYKAENVPILLTTINQLAIKTSTPLSSINTAVRSSPITKKPNPIIKKGINAEAQRKNRERRAIQSRKNARAANITAYRKATAPLGRTNSQETEIGNSYNRSTQLTQPYFGQGRTHKRKYNKKKMTRRYKRLLRSITHKRK